LLSEILLFIWTELLLGL